MPSHNAFEPFDKFVKVAVFRVVRMEVRYFRMCRQRQWHRVRTVVDASSACHRGSASLSGGQRESRTCTHYPSPGRHGVQHNTMSFSRARSIHRCVCMFAVLLALAILSLTFIMSIQLTVLSDCWLGCKNKTKQKRGVGVLLT